MGTILNLQWPSTDLQPFDTKVVMNRLVHSPFYHRGIYNFFVTIVYFQAIRIVLRSIQQHAAMYDRYIEPLVCISVDFYIRCFVRMHTGAQKAKDGAA